MKEKRISKLNSKKRYLQIALNGTLSDAKHIIRNLPRDERIIIEAGTPFIKRYGIQGIRDIHMWYQRHLLNQPIDPIGAQQTQPDLVEVIKTAKRHYRALKEKQATPFQNVSQKAPILPLAPYVVADLKMMDRGDTEVQLAHEAGASAATALGHAPIESLDAFISQCQELDLDSMIDMMNVDFPLAVLRKLKIQPDIVILHRGVDEERDNKQKMLPLHEIRRVKGSCDILIAVAGGDTSKEIQSALFNDADIVVVWKNFYQGGEDTSTIAKKFLRDLN